TSRPDCSDRVEAGSAPDRAERTGLDARKLGARLTFLCNSARQIGRSATGVDRGSREIIDRMEHDAMPPDTSPGTTRSPRKLRWILITLAAAIILAAVIYQIVTFLSQPAVRRGRFADAGTPQSVGVKRIHRGDIRLTINALGAVTPLTTITVNTQISGQLMEVGFKEGQLVHKGQFLAQIDPRPYQIALEQNQAQLVHDQATLHQAQSDLERYRALLERDSIAKQTVDDQVWLVQQVEGTVRVDQALIDQQRLNLQYCRVTA